MMLTKTTKRKPKTKRKLFLAAGMLFGSGCSCNGAAPAPKTGPAPILESAEPSFGAPGSTIELKGRYLNRGGRLVVEFDEGVTAPVELSAGAALVRIPDDAAGDSIVVRNRNGASEELPFELAIRDNEPWASFTVGSFHTCGIKLDGTLYCWGENHAGQLGTSTVASSAYPRAVSAPRMKWASIAAGSYLEFGNTCGIERSGALWCWGDNGNYQYGNGVNDSHWKPRPAADVGTPWDSVSMGSYHVCGISGEELYCWGAFKTTALETGDEYPLPFTIAPQGSQTGWTAVAAGTLHTCAISSPDGNLYCWGENEGGQLGTNSKIGVTTPTEIMPGTQWLSVSSGSYISEGNTCGVQLDASLWCWGDNEYGQVGDATNDDRLTPVDVSQGMRWRSVSLGGLHACAIAEDRSLWCWGSNSFAQLGSAKTDTPQRTPARIGADSDWDSVAAGGYHTCAKKTDGSLYCWGGNRGGQLGFQPESGIQEEPRRVEARFR